MLYPTKNKKASDISKALSILVSHLDSLLLRLKKASLSTGFSSRCKTKNPCRRQGFLVVPPGLEPGTT
ncbi:hypothetical protein FK178_12160 [Antarcticibacterium arcticum]|uniref:Uncharacterized protein n=1 Tax=Antarcticibacterium arcticum TaxID=2585771 RepID=A0A5B8YLJ1_9FLAO|nr:hypothetical protein FK178_12160 [Antarcticibacterium arcticum]